MEFVVLPVHYHRTARTLNVLMAENVCKAMKSDIVSDSDMPLQQF